MSDVIKQVAKYYDERTKNSDNIDAAGQWQPKELVSEICQEISKKIGIKYDDRVLEIGCGSGVLGDPIIKNISFYVGVDISFMMLKKFLGLPINENKLNLIQSTAAEIPILNNFFSIIILNSITMYFPNKEYLKKTLREIERVACPSATIFMGENSVPERYYYEFAWFQNLGIVGQTFAKPYIRIRKWLAKTSPRLAGKWKNVYMEISPQFIIKYFTEKGDVSVSDTAAYTIRKRVFGKNCKGNRRMDFIIRLGKSK